MIIVIAKWKKKLVGLVTAMIIVVAFAAVIPLLSGILYNKIPVFSGWFRDERPSGNPMRVERTQEGTRFDKAIDQFVIKLQDFYYD
ncbi:MAG: hypothetical protein ACOX6I_06400 [Syntrophomonadaceae bacterium]|jgi:hypothetical protein